MKGRTAIQRAFAALVLMLSLLGCGGDNGDAVAAWRGAYGGSTTVDSGRKATLSVDVASSGTTTGTLAVTDPSLIVRDGGFTFPAGSYSMNGTTQANGDLFLSGFVAGSGDFTITGSLAHSGQTGAFTIFAGGLTYSGTLVLNGNAGPGGADLAFSNATNTNADTSDWPVDADTGFTALASSTSAFTSTGSGASTRNFTFTISSSVQVGATANFSSGITQVSATYSEGTGDPPKKWSATSGSLKLVARTSSSLSFELNNVKFENLGADTTNSAAGTFVVNGTIVK